MRRCVLPKGSSAARWRQAYARFYATKDGEEVVKRPKGRPRKAVDDQLGTRIKRIKRIKESKDAELWQAEWQALLGPNRVDTLSGDVKVEDLIRKPTEQPRKSIDGQSGSGIHGGRVSGVEQALPFSDCAGIVCEGMVSRPNLSTILDHKEPVREMIEGLRMGRENDKRPDSAQDETRQIPEQACPSISTVQADQLSETISTHFPHSASPLLEKRDFPLSPFMDPAFLAAREKHKLPKGPRTRGDPGSFQARLAKNPYALALATPTRQCRITEIILPRFFLQDYNMMAHPETGETWYVPSSLAKREHSGPKSRKEVGKKGSEETESSKSETTNDMSKQNASKGKKIGGDVYLLSSSLMLAELQTKKAKFSVNRLIPQRIRHLPIPVRTASRARWRTDMGPFIKELWRRRISEDMIHVKGLKKGYLVDRKDWEDAKESRQVGAFLWIGDASESGKVAPKQWATIDVQHGDDSSGEVRKVPVYNMRTMLGEAALAKLMQGQDGKRAVLGGHIVMVKDKKVTLELRMKLWKFQGFMASPEPEMEVVYDGDEEEDWDDDDDEEDDEDEEGGDNYGRYPDLEEDGVKLDIPQPSQKTWSVQALTGRAQ